LSVFDEKMIAQIHTINPEVAQLLKFFSAQKLKKPLILKTIKEFLNQGKNTLSVPSDTNLGSSFSQFTIEENNRIGLRVSAE
jgi:hypothetical protein